MKFKLNPVVCGAASAAAMLTVHCRSTVVAIVSTNGGAQWRRLVGIESDDVGRLDTGRPPTLTQLLSKYTIFSFSRYVNVRIIIPTLSVFPHHAGDRKLFVIPFCHCFKQCDLSYLSRSPTQYILLVIRPVPPLHYQCALHYTARRVSAKYSATSSALIHNKYIHIAIVAIALPTGTRYESENVWIFKQVYVFVIVREKMPLYIHVMFGESRRIYMVVSRGFICIRYTFIMWVNCSYKTIRRIRKWYLLCVVVLCTMAADISPYIYIIFKWVGMLYTTHRRHLTSSLFTHLLPSCIRA